MKKLLTLTFFLTAFALSAQTGINYKALVKDGSGAILANQSVTVQLSILEGTVQTNVYQETHILNTDDNGIVILNIGDGTVDSGDYSLVAWGGDTHFLNVQIDAGSGLTDLGTTQFMTVPYALSAGNVTGIETLDEGNGVGRRLIGRDPANYGDIGLEGLDLSVAEVPNDVAGATGDYSVAIGNVAIASAEGSIAMGRIARSESYYATALGYRNADFTGSPDSWVPTDPLFQIGNGGELSESNALNILKNGTILAPSFSISEITDGKSLITKEYLEATTVSATGLEFVTEGGSSGWRIIGRDETKYADIGLAAIDLSFSRFILDGGASGDYSTAVGRETKAEAYSSLAVGRFNVGGGNPTAWAASDPLFEIGNGSSVNNKSNALTVLKNGTITAPEFDLAEITDPKALITKEYADTNLLSSGLEALDEGNGIGWRLATADPANHANIGWNAIDLSTNYSASEIFGATGNASLTLGSSCLASGSNSVAIGSNTLATADHAVSFGRSQANGIYSFAFGFLPRAEESHSIAMGRSVRSLSRHEVTLGAHNELYVPNDADGWDPEDRIFAIGNGEDEVNRSNALTVLKNGKVGIGVHQPSAFLEISSVNNTNEPTVKLIHDGTTGARINFTDTGVTNGNRWTLYGDADDNDAASIFNIFHPNKGNILRIQGNGEIGVNGLPNTELHVYHGTSGANDGFKLENTGGNNNWWRMYTVNSTGNLNLYSENQGTTSVGNFDNTSGAYTSTSDRRLKKNFEALHFNWGDFMKLETLTYQYKVQKDQKEHIGLVAQDVEPIYPELVNYNEEEDVYHLNYSGFGVVAIKAIQEQQKIIEDQASKIEELEAKLSEKNNKMANIEERLATIEKSLIK